MIFETPVISGAFQDVHGRIEELRKQLSYATERRQWLGFLSRVMFARAIQSSNSIEGFNVTVNDAIAAVAGDDPSDISREQEAWTAVVGYRNAMTYVLQVSDDRHFEMSNTLIRSLHYMMQSYDLTKHPGRWRPGPIFMANQSTGERVYVGPNAEHVPELMDELIASVSRDLEAGTPLIHAAMAHLNLVMIHPFSDGNGRMARCLQTLMLARQGILSPQFCSIEEYIGRNVQDYYGVLAEVGAGEYHPERDATPWIKFCLTAHYRQAQTLMQRTRDLARLWAELEKITESLGLPERALSALADAALGFRVRNSTYRAQTDTTMAAASYDLAKLATAGLLEAVSFGRGRHYIASERLRDVRKKTREPKMAVDDPFAQGTPAPTSVIAQELDQPEFPGFWPEGL